MSDAILLEDKLQRAQHHLSAAERYVQEAMGLCTPAQSSDVLIILQHVEWACCQISHMTRDDG